MACRFTELIIDCHDHDRVGRFWQEVLGYEVTDRSDGPEDFYVELTGPPGSGPRIVVARSPDEKAAKSPIHIDVNATDRDRDAEVERILALGATHADIGQGDDVPWVVLADPAGNEFCVLRSRVDPHGD